MTGGSVGAGTTNVVGAGEGDVSAMGEAAPDGSGAADGWAQAAVHETNRLSPRAPNLTARG